MMRSPILASSSYDRLAVAGVRTNARHSLFVTGSCKRWDMAHDTRPKRVFLCLEEDTNTTFLDLLYERTGLSWDELQSEGSFFID